MRDLNVTRHADKLRVLAGIKGGMAVEALSPELKAVVVLEGPMPDTDRAAGIRRWATRVNRAPVAAQFGHGFIVNPVGSGVLTTVTLLVCSPGMATDVFYGLRLKRDVGGIIANPPAGAAADVSGIIHVDTRDEPGFNTPFSSTATLLFVLTDATGGYSAFSIGTVGAGAAASMDHSLGIVLGEGDAFVIDGAAVNAGLDVTVWGYERPHESSELFRSSR